MKPKLPPLKPSEWRRRRFRLDIALTAIFLWISWIILSGNDTVVFQQLSIALVGAGTALIGQYIFGAVWDDKNYMNALKELHQTDSMAETEESTEIPPAEPEQKEAE